MRKEATGRREGKKLAEVVQEVGQSPLSRIMLSKPFPRKCSLPTFGTPFNGTGDAIEHLRSYRMTLTQWNHYDIVMCRLFPVSLKDEALMWFNNLPKKSVKYFDHLTELFLEAYIHNSRVKPEIDMLFQLARGPNASLRSLVARWRKLCAEIGRVPEAYTILGFKNILRKTDPIFVRMYETMPPNLGKLREIQEDYIALEELQDGTYDKLVKGTSRGANVVEPQDPQPPIRGAGRPNNGQPISIHIEVEDGEGETKPNRRKRSLWTHHPKDSCRDLKKVVHDLVDEGKVPEYIAQPAIQSVAGPPVHRAEIPREAQYSGCNTISHSAVTMPDANITWRIHKRNFQGEELFCVSKEPPMEDWMKIHITFSAFEAPDNGQNHNDPLVVTMAIALPETEGVDEKLKGLPWEMPKVY
ncbi:uncharacterized protein LOC113272684 [Papaver somniferum]|uniref:uncharacterized protein LOC113272684 n=1 Tax=Papaver somniferum TaxID=3469 RepID=UPI000E6F4CA7|nr:uncharacterized protein LOC113272684 [Papaver somniferum]